MTAWCAVRFIRYYRLLRNISLRHTSMQQSLHRRFAITTCSPIRKSVLAAGLPDGLCTDKKTKIQQRI